ncbi:MAG: hypothetical protein KGH61_03360 [Candidatus Micrarchaeota archaeon]|nr:hypothetical protein [Candidatus Micrarchaeota archaeon]MDE1847960.1 hypothetical protein [Candidatus Micrarchaeota archaeon]MDE1864322.1 hypothetical protein [Candidatus Micrarchaeota archaeon]
MNRSVIVYISILVILAIFAFFTYSQATQGGGLLGGPKSSTSTSTAPSTQTTTILVGSNSSTTTIPPQGSCLSSASTAQILNGNFSTGTFLGWNQTGGGFGTGPTNLTYANENHGYYNHTWTNYNGGFFASTYHGGLGVQPGNLTSDSFQVTEPYLNFKIISAANSGLYVQVLQGNQTVAATHYNTYIQGNPYPSSQFLNASIPLSTVLCDKVRIRVVANVVGNIQVRNQYIAVGDFYLGKSPSPNANLIIVNQTVG